MNDMAVHLYAKRSLVADYLRSFAGLAFAAVGLYALGDSDFFVRSAMITVGGIFALYGLRAVAQGLTRIEVDDEGVARLGPVPTRIQWRDIRRMTLRHYSVKRDRTSGWLELNLSDGRSAPWRSIRVDSGLVGFQKVAAQAAAAAASNGVRLDGASADNLTVLGISAAAPAVPLASDRPLLRRNAQ